VACTRNTQQSLVIGTAAVLAQKGLQLLAAVHVHCMAFLSAEEVPGAGASQLAAAYMLCLRCECSRPCVGQLMRRS
jgi:hypothetical protein